MLYACSYRACMLAGTAAELLAGGGGPSWDEAGRALAAGAGGPSPLAVTCFLVVLEQFVAVLQTGLRCRTTRAPAVPARAGPACRDPLAEQCINGSFFVLKFAR